MYYVGLDVHKNQSTICVLDSGGQPVRNRTIRGPWGKVLEEVAKVKRPFSVCFEASTGYGYLYRRLTPMAHRVVVAHPGHLRLIFGSKRKNDRVDARKLATLLMVDAVRPVYVPSEGVQAWRGMIEHRRRLVGERTRIKNGLRALLRTHGLAAPRGLWSANGLAWLRGVEWSHELDAWRRDELLARLEMLNASVRRAQKALDRIARNHPGVQLLTEIPGVGYRTAEAVVAYIDDPHRFGSNKTVGSYFGLVPCQDASAQANRLGHITRQGPASVRGLLVEAAWQGIRRSARLRTFFERVQHGRPERKKIALVATCHYLLRIMLAMLQTGEAWRREAV
jgi:transposase